MQSLARCGAAALMLLAGGCTFYPEGPETAAADTGPPVVRPFEERLAAEYRQLAAVLDEAGASEDAAYFVDRAERVARGERIEPTYPPRWDVPYPLLGELGTAQASLILYRVQGADTSAPDATAVAQGNFDCWVQATASGSDAAERLAACRDRYRQAIRQVEAAMPPPQAAGAAATGPDGPTVTGGGPGTGLTNPAMMDVPPATASPPSAGSPGRRPAARQPAGPNAAAPGGQG